MNSGKCWGGAVCAFPTRDPPHNAFVISPCFMWHLCNQQQQLDQFVCLIGSTTEETVASCVYIRGGGNFHNFPSMIIIIIIINYRNFIVCSSKVPSPDKPAHLFVRSSFHNLPTATHNPSTSQSLLMSASGKCLKNYCSAMGGWCPESVKCVFCEIIIKLHRNSILAMHILLHFLSCPLLLTGSWNTRTTTVCLTQQN